MYEIEISYGNEGGVLVFLARRGISIHDARNIVWAHHHRLDVNSVNLVGKVGHKRHG